MIDKVINDLMKRYMLTEDECKLLEVLAKNQLLHMLSEQYINMNRSALEEFRKALQFKANPNNPSSPYTIRIDGNIDIREIIKRIINRIPDEYKTRLSVSDDTHIHLHNLISAIEMNEESFDIERFINNVIAYYNDDNPFKKRLDNLIRENGLSLYYSNNTNKSNML